MPGTTSNYIFFGCQSSKKNTNSLTESSPFIPRRTFSALADLDCGKSHNDPNDLAPRIPRILFTNKRRDEVEKSVRGGFGHAIAKTIYKNLPRIKKTRTVGLVKGEYP